MLCIPDLPISNESKSGWPWTGESPQLTETMPDGSPWPHISIVTPSYNQAQFIEETIRSVLLQGYPYLEYIIVDGGSTDGSLEIIKKYESWLDYWISEPDRGQSHAINKGMARATGEWVAWLNSDDYYLPGCLSRVAQIMASEPEVSWIVGMTDLREDGRTVYQFPPKYLSDEELDVRFVTNGWTDFVCTKKTGTGLPQPSSFWKRAAWQAEGGLDETLDKAMDHDLYVRLAYSGYRPRLINITLAVLRLHKAQKTQLGVIPFWEEELKVIDRSLLKASSEEKRILLHYRTWLDTRIRQMEIDQFLRQYPLLLRIWNRISRLVNQSV